MREAFENMTQIFLTHFFLSANLLYTEDSQYSQYSQYSAIVCTTRLRVRLLPMRDVLSYRLTNDRYYYRLSCWQRRMPKPRGTIRTISRLLIARVPATYN